MSVINYYYSSCLTCFPFIPSLFYIVLNDDYMLCKVSLGVLKGASKLNVLLLLTHNRRFQKSPLWPEFLEMIVFCDKKRVEISAFSLRVNGALVIYICIKSR